MKGSRQPLTCLVLILSLAWISFAATNGTKRSGRPGGRLSPDVAARDTTLPAVFQPAEGGLGEVGLLGSMWQAVRPYIFRKETPDLGARLAAFKRQLLTKAEDLVALHTRIPDARLLAGRRWPRRRRHSEWEDEASVERADDQATTPTGSVEDEVSASVGRGDYQATTPTGSVEDEVSASVERADDKATTPTGSMEDEVSVSVERADDQATTPTDSVEDEASVERADDQTITPTGSVEDEVSASEERADDQETTATGSVERPRSKREHLQGYALVRDTEGVPVLAGVEGAVSLGVPGAQAVHMTLWRGRLFVAIIDNYMNVSLYTVDPRTLKASYALTIPGKNSCEFTVVPGDVLLLACIAPFTPSKHTASNIHEEVMLYEVMEETPDSLSLRFWQKIDAQSSLDLTMWIQGGKNYLLIADSQVLTESFSFTSTGTKLMNKTNYHTVSRLYHWTGHYFDVLQELPGTHPRGLRHFLVGNTHFIAIANFRNNIGHHNCYSIIYRYSKVAGHYVLFQEVFTKGAFHIESFTLGNSRHNDTFLAVANYCQDDQNGACNPDTTSTIYRYHYGKFVAFQEIRTSYAVQWLAMKVEDTVLLAVANAVAGVRFFQYNGWRFAPTAVQHFAGPFGAGVTRMAAVTWNNAVLMAVTNSDPLKAGRDVPTLYAITFSRDKSLQEFHETSQRWCMERLRKLSRQDVTNLLQRMQKAPKATLGYTFTQPVVIHGHLRVLLASQATKVYERQRNVWIPPSWENLTEAVKVLGHEATRLEARFRHVISHRGPATWPAGLHLTRVEASQVSAVTSVSSLQSPWVNGQSVLFDHLIRLNMRSSINQGMLSFDHILSQGATWVEKLMGRAMSSYVTLTGRHTLSGGVTFRGRVAASRLMALVTVDGVRVDRDVLFTTTIHNYTGLVTCDQVTSGAVHVTTINNINMTKLFQSVVLRDAPHTTAGRVVVVGDLVYHRDLEADITSCINLDNPLRVDRSETQVITGHHRVGGMRCQSARVTGRVNEVSVPEEVFLRGTRLSYSVSSAAFTHLLASSLTINTALNTITVSNKKLDVLHVFAAHQVVVARKTFSSMRLLKEDSRKTYNSDRRQRRESDNRREACGVLIDQELPEETRQEALLGTLRVLAASQNLLTLFNDVHPGEFPPNQNTTFYTRLAQEAPWVLNPTASDLLLCDVFLDNWVRRESQTDQAFFKRENITFYRENIEKVITNTEARLAKLDTSMHDVFLILRSARRLISQQDKHLHTLNLLIYVLDAGINEGDSHGNYDSCRLVCPQGFSKNITDPDRGISTCEPSIFVIYDALKRIVRYPLILETMAQLSGQQVVLQTAVVEHELGRLVEMIQGKSHLWKGLQVAVLCSASPGNREERIQILEMLVSYHQRLGKASPLSLKMNRTTLKRTRRNVPLKDSVAVPGTNASSSESTAAANDAVGATRSSLVGGSGASVASGSSIAINIPSRAGVSHPSWLPDSNQSDLDDEGNRLQLLENSSVGLLAPPSTCPGCQSGAASSLTRGSNLPSQDLPTARLRLASEAADDVMHVPLGVSPTKKRPSRCISNTEAPSTINTSSRSGVQSSITVASVFSLSNSTDGVKIPYQENSMSFFTPGDYCHNISLYYYEDFNQFNRIIDEIKIFRQFLHIIASTHPWDLDGPLVDERLDAEIFAIFGIIVETVEHFVYNPLQPLGSMNATSLIKEALLFDAAMDFASLSQYKFSNTVTPIIGYLEMLIINATKSIENTLGCFDSCNLRNVSTSYVRLQKNLPVVSPYPEVTSFNITQFIAMLAGNKALLSSVDYLMTFVGEVLAVNPWKRHIDQPVLSVNSSFVVGTAGRVRDVLYSILADEPTFFAEYPSQVLRLILADHKIAMKKAQMLLPDHLAENAEKVLRQIYGTTDPSLADEAQKILYSRRRNLENANDAISKLIKSSSARGTEGSNSGVDKNPLGFKNTSLGSTDQPPISWMSSVSGSWASGRVAGYRLEDIARQHGVVHDRLRIVNIIASSKRVRNLVFRARLSASVVNGVAVRRVEGHGVPLSATVIAPSFTFSDVTAAGKLDVEFINNMPAASFVTLQGDHHLPCPLTFTESVMVGGRVIVSSTVNNHDLLTFSTGVVLTSGPPQVFLTPVTFLNLAAVSMVCDAGRVAGVSLGDLLTRGRTSVITGRKRFLEVEVREGDVEVAGLKVDFINEVNVTDLFIHSLRRNPGGVQVVSGSLQGKHLVAKQPLVSRGFTVGLPGDAGRLDLRRLASQVVYRDLDSTINARLTFAGRSSFSNLYFQDTFDLVSAARYSGGWLLQTTDQTLEGHVTVASMTSSRVTTALGVKIQEVDYSHLLNSAALISEPVTLSSVRLREVKSLGRVSVTGRVQGWDLSQDAILPTTSNLVFTSSLTFLAHVNITGNFLATRGINDGILAPLCGPVSLGTLTVTGTVRYTMNASVDVVLLGQHRISQERVRDFWLIDRDVILEEALTLKKVTARHVTTIKSNTARLTGVKERMLMRQCSSGSEAPAEVLTETFTFTHLTVESLHTPTLEVLTMNDSPLSALQQVLTRGGDQVITGHYTLNSILVNENLITSDTVNGKRMPHFCKQRELCHVHAAKTFTKDVTVRNSLSVRNRRTVQGVDVSLAFSTWIDKLSCGYVPGLTTFATTQSITLPVPDILVQGSVDGVKVSRDRLLTISDNQAMTGALTVNTQSGGSVVGPALTATDGFFNTLNLTHLKDSTCRLDRNVRVSSPVHFREPVVFVDGNYYVDNAHMDAVMSGEFKSLFDLQTLLHAFMYTHSLSLHSQRVVRGQVREYWGWRSVQKFEDVLERIVPLTIPWGKTAAGSADGVAPVLASKYLVLISKQGDTEVLEYDTGFRQYRHAGMTIEANCTSKVVGFTFNSGQQTLAMGHSCPQDGREYTNAIFPPIYRSTQHPVKGDEILRMWDLPSNGTIMSDAIRVSGIADMQVVVIEKVVCLVVVEARGASIVLLCDGPHGFKKRQRIRTTNPTKVCVAEHSYPDGRLVTIMVVANPANSSRDAGSLFVYVYDVNFGEFLRVQEERLENVVWVDLASYDTDLLLAALTEDGHGDLGSKVVVYRLDWTVGAGTTLLGHLGSSVKTPSPTTDPSFFLVQELPVPRSVEVRFSLLPLGQLCLYVINRDGLVTWFCHKGIHRFRKEGELRMPGKQTLEAWMSFDGENVVHRISLAGQSCSDKKQKSPRLPGEVLEMRIRG